LRRLAETLKASQAILLFHMPGSADNSFFRGLKELLHGFVVMSHFLTNLDQDPGEAAAQFLRI
jgi:hypothetical protein